MIPKYLSEMWTALAPALGDHLWQSTLFAAAAGLLTLVLQKNHAGARYWLWLAASLKFLVPFSLLVGLGNHLAWIRSATGTKAPLWIAMKEVGQPFTQATVPVSSGVVSLPPSPGLIHLLPALLTAVWLCGFVAVLSAWSMRWRKVSRALREAVPLQEGREVEALRRMERVGGVRRRIEMFLCAASLEPGIFGIGRPVLVWPEGISRYLEDAHLEAILAHEVWHVRRHDNLAAAMHMLVEATFWFHPLVWWLGARLVDERERACDEGVLELGNERHVYAESILKTCEFCAGFSLVCVSGVTGANLKKRIVHIMTQGVPHKLDFSKRLLIGTAGLVAIAVPILFGLLNPTPGRAETQAENPGGRTHVLHPFHPNRDQPAGKAVLPVATVVSPNTTACRKSVRAPPAGFFREGRSCKRTLNTDDPWRTSDAGTGEHSDVLLFVCSDFRVMLGARGGPNRFQHGETRNH